MRFSTLLIAALTLAPRASLLLAQNPAQPQSASQDRGARAAAPGAVAKNDAWRQRKDYALLFATNDYDTWEPLTNPIPDAKAIAAELEDNYGFQAELVQNPTRERIFTKLREYSLKDYGQGDQLFIFFAGHGVFDDVFRQGFIVAKDSRKNDETRAGYASYDDLRTIVDSMRSKHVFLVVDACYSGAIDRRIGEASTRGSEVYPNLSFPELFGKKIGLQTRKFLTSGGKDYVPDGLPGHHSPFAAHLLDELRTYGRSQGYLTVSNILTAVERTNPEPHWGEWGYNEPGSEFFFVAKQFTAKLMNGPSTNADPGATSPSRGDATLLPTGRPSIAVMGFRNLSARPDDAWLSTALSEWLTTELGAGEKLRAIAGENVARVKLDLRLQESSGFAKDTLGTIFKSLGAEYIVSGSYTALARPSQGTIRVDLRLQNAATGEMVEQAAEQGSQSDLPELARRLGARLRNKLGIEVPTPDETKAVQAALPARTGFSRPYAEGLAKLRAYDLLGARDSLEAAVAAEPKSALAHHALSRAWSELGYDAKAKLEEADAADLAGSLSLESKRAIEASSSRLNARLDRAIEIYRSLWTFFPDEPDYALQLASVETDAGKGQEALATLDNLRRSSTQAADDPRVDLEEALAASSLSDLKLKQAAAARSAEKASKQGARLLEAEAHWQNCSALFALGDQSRAEAECMQASQASDLSAGRKVRARSATVLATIRDRQGKSSEAMELRQEALNIATQIGSRKDIVGALINLARLQRRLGQVAEARRNYSQALANAVEIDDRQQLANLQLNLAVLSYQEHNFREAQETFEQCRQSALNIGDKTIVILASKNLAILYLQLGKLEKAESSVRDAVARAQASGLQRDLASSYSTLGDVLLAQNNLAGARKSYQDALELFTKFNDNGNIAGAQVSLGAVSLEEGDLARAETLAREAITALQTEKDPDGEASARELLARVLMTQGKLDEALEQITAAKSRQSQEYSIAASVTITGAKLDMQRGRLDEARLALETSLRESQRLELAGLQLEVRLAQVELASASDPKSSALQIQSLEQDAKKDGYLRIAAKAARLGSTR